MMPGNLNLKGIAEMAPPANYTEVRRFLGMTGFFRRFIKNYARIAKPLNDILEGEASKLKSEAVTLPPDALDAFEKLKMCCMTAPVLAFADFKREFQLETDASSEGLGAILSQKQLDGKWHPIAFGSRELKGGEAKYHLSKLEFLALKWAITEQFLGIPAVQAIHRADRQQSPHLHSYDAKSRCTGPPLGCRPGRL